MISTDGVKWDKLKSGSVSFSGHMKLNTNGLAMSARWPSCLASAAPASVTPSRRCGTAWPTAATTIHRDRRLRPRDHTAVHRTGIAVVPYGDQIITRCNEHLQADGPTKSYSFSQAFDASFAATTDKVTEHEQRRLRGAPGSGFLPSAQPHRAWHFRRAGGLRPGDQAADRRPRPSISASSTSSDVKLFLTTYQNQQPGSNPGTVCPALKVTSRAQANQAGPVTMRIWRQKDGGPITSEVQQAWASYDAAKNGYFAT